MKDLSLSEQMIEESNVILKSVDWIEKRLNNLHILAEKAYNNDNYHELERIRVEVNNYLSKLVKEHKNMDDFMLKYSTIIQNEKKKMLSYLGEKKQIHIRCVPKNKRRKTESRSL